MDILRSFRAGCSAMFILIAATPFILAQGVHLNPSPAPGAPRPEETFALLPYTINLKALAALDPKPLRLNTIKEDEAPFRRGYRVVSMGRVFPISYDVLITPEGPGQETLEGFSKSLDGHADILLKTFGTNERLGKYLHYFQRYESNGKPEHVSSNYVFIKNRVFYRVMASSWGAAMIKLDAWPPIKPDANSEAEVTHLLDAMTFK